MKKAAIQFPDFMKLDIRVGEILSASVVEGSRNLLEFEVDLGEEYGKVIILTGLSHYYKPDKFIGNKYAFLANLEPKKMLNKYSYGMMLVVDDEKKPVPLKINKKLRNGLVIR